MMEQNQSHIDQHVAYANVDKKPTFLPIIDCFYQIDIVNNFAHITLRQIFKNDSNKDLLEVYYSMPVDPEFCLCSFEVKYLGEKVEGEVKKIDQIKIEEKRVLQSSANEENLVSSQFKAQYKSLMEIKIRKLPMHETVTITSKFLTALEPYRNNWWILRIPSQMAPRWNQFQPQSFQNNETKVSFNVTIRNSFKILGWKSYNHDLQRIQNNQRQNIMRFQLLTNGSSISEKDFVLTYQQDNWGKLQCTLGRRCLVMTKFHPQISKTYKGRHEIYFLIDSSASMKDYNRIELAKSAAKCLLKSLPSDDQKQENLTEVKFNLIHFQNDFYCYSEHLVQNSTPKRDQAIQWIDLIKEQGMTRIEKPLEWIEKQLKNTRTTENEINRNIIVLTDGEMYNQDKILIILNRLKKEYKTATHFIGIGQSGNSINLIKKGCSYNNFTAFLETPEELAEKMIDTLNYILDEKIMLIDVKLPFCLKQCESYPSPQDLESKTYFKKKVLNVFFQFKQDDSIYEQILRSIIKITYQDEQKRKHQDQEILLSAIGAGFKNDLCFWKYSGFLQIAEKQRQENFNPQEIIQKSLHYNVLSSQTAFACRFSPDKLSAGGNNNKKHLKLSLKLSDDMMLKSIKQAIQVAGNMEIQFYMNNQIKDSITALYKLRSRNPTSQEHITLTLDYSKIVIITQVNYVNIQNIQIRLVSKKELLERKYKDLSKIKSQLSQYAVLPSSSSNSFLEKQLQYLRRVILKEFNSHGQLNYNQELLTQLKLLPTFEKFKQISKNDDEAMTLSIEEYICINCRGDLKEIKMIVAKMIKFVDLKMIENTALQQMKLLAHKMIKFEALKMMKLMVLKIKAIKKLELLAHKMIMIKFAALKMIKLEVLKIKAFQKLKLVTLKMNKMNKFATLKQMKQVALKIKSLSLFEFDIQSRVGDINFTNPLTATLTSNYLDNQGMRALIRGNKPFSRFRRTFRIKLKLLEMSSSSSYQYRIGICSRTSISAYKRSNPRLANFHQIHLSIGSFARFTSLENKYQFYYLNWKIQENQILSIRYDIQTKEASFFVEGNHNKMLNKIFIKQETDSLYPVVMMAYKSQAVKIINLTSA